METNAVSGVGNNTGTRPLPQPQARVRTRDETALRQACCEFEGLLTGILLKQGMKPSPFADSDTPPGHVQIQEYAIEQASQKLGRDGALGIADMLYEQLLGE